MIANVFFNSSINSNNKQIYTEQYLEYFLTNLIFNNTKCNLDYIFKTIKTKYGNVQFKKTLTYLNKHFKQKNGFFVLNANQERACLKIKKLKNDLFLFEQVTEKEIFSKLSSYITQHLINYENGLYYAILLLIKSKKISIEICESIYFDFLYNNNLYNLKADIAISLVHETYDSLPLNLFISNRITLELLFANGINTIKDLKQLSPDSLTIAFSFDFENIINSLDQLKEEFSTIFKDRIYSLFNELKPREIEILSYRNGFSGQKSLTLEEVGALYELTRERCRQIEARAIKKIIAKADSVKTILINLYLSLCTFETRYISEDKIRKYVSDDKLTNYILFIYENSNLNIVYNHDLRVLYNKSITTIEDICNEIIEVYGDIISFAEYNYLNSFEKSVINYSYKLYKDIIYVKKGISTKVLISLTIDDLFPNGYRISDQEDYSKLHEEFKKRYGDINDFPSDRSIVGFLDRLDYCQINKGTYKNRKYCAKLPQYLIDEIINYLLLNPPAVYYSSIYEKYKNRLNELGIDNYYYLKGAIDSFLPSDFTTKRNYIMIGEEKITITETVINYMKSFNGQFTMDQLKNKFIGVKEYTFMNIIYNECEKDLISLGNSKYIYIDKVVINDDTVKEFKKFISNIFDLMNTNVISARKIYARLSLLNQDLLNRLKIATDSFSTFSLIYHFFKDDYGFNRPLISLNKNENINQYIIISNYVSELETFNHKTIKNYISKMNLRDLYSYSEFMEDQSDNFVQINVDTMVSKTKFILSEDDLKEIKKMLELIFTRFDEIDTKKFNGYAMLPKLNYVWNKYLLVGIIRSFFDETYEVKNTEATYDTTDFIIRRIK